MSQISPQGVRTLARSTIASTTGTGDTGATICCSDDLLHRDLIPVPGSEQVLRNVCPGLKSSPAQWTVHWPLRGRLVAQKMLLDGVSACQHLPTIIRTGNCALDIVSSSCVLVKTRFALANNLTLSAKYLSFRIINKALVILIKLLVIFCNF